MAMYFMCFEALLRHLKAPGDTCAAQINSGRSIGCTDRASCVASQSAVTALRFNKSGALLASGSKDTDVIVWDVVGETGMFHDQARCALCPDPATVHQRLCPFPAAQPPCT